MLPEEQAGNSRYFYELASGRFGWTPDVLAKVQAFHFQGGQGAKTGTGGHLPGDKVTGRIAEVRGLTVLKGVRGRPPGDLAALAHAIASLSRLAHDPAGNLDADHTHCRVGAAYDRRGALRAARRDQINILLLRSSARARRQARLTRVEGEMA